MPVVIPYIPEFITVHLGPPSSYSQNVTVSFVDYIKNVASSEIYPTWNESAVYANIYAQISFALNRVYLEFYPSQGYPFNITSSTAYDQSFEYGRNIFDNISRIVDNIFDEYIRRIGFIEPLSAKYCNGTTVTCDGLSQWGSESLANQGYNSMQILRYYYGDDIELVVDAPIQGVVESYPGTPLSLGSSGENVKVIQVSLNRISQNYPLIPKMSVDGIFGELTQEAVRTFQGIFNLTADGIVGKSTWYALVRLYTGIKNLSELQSEGQQLFGSSLEYPDAISEGDEGEKVVILQYLLSVLSQFYDTVPFVEITGRFSNQTKLAVIAVQNNNDLPPTGVVNAQTWDVIYKEFIGISETVFRGGTRNDIQVEPYPGEVLKLGSRGDSVRTLQQYLNTISLVYDAVSPVQVTGVFDQQTMLSVMQYQEYFNLPITGQVDREVWNQITNTYKDVVSAATVAPIQFPGRTLKLGSRDINSTNR